MNLYILRHGEAEDYTQPDKKRALTARGEQQVHGIAKQYLQDTIINTVLVSPYLRAQQTAALTTPLLKSPFSTSTCELIEPEGSVQKFCDYAYSLNVEHLLIVSHQTFVGRLIETLTGNSLGYGMGTANLAALDLITPARNCGELLWIKAPNNDL